MPHVNEKTESGDSKDDSEAAGVDEQVTREMEAAVEGEDVVMMP